jgi:hypothetical protein
VHMKRLLFGLLPIWMLVSASNTSASHNAASSLLAHLLCYVSHLMPVYCTHSIQEVASRLVKHRYHRIRSSRNALAQLSCLATRRLLYSHMHCCLYCADIRWTPRTDAEQEVRSALARSSHLAKCPLPYPHCVCTVRTFFDVPTQMRSRITGW